MMKDEHERERRAFWDTVFHNCQFQTMAQDAMAADLALAERDKRWPAPAEPKTSAGQDADEADECETCKFHTLGPFQEPCRSCSTISLTTTSHWEPIK